MASLAKVGQSACLNLDNVVSVVLFRLLDFLRTSYTKKDIPIDGYHLGIRHFVARLFYGHFEHL